MSTQLSIQPKAAHQAYQPGQYMLPESDRQAILAQAPTPAPAVLSAAMAAQIEKQRSAFIAMHGCPFGCEEN